MATINFFQRQEQAKKNTGYLLVGFTVAVISVVVLMWAAISLLLAANQTMSAHGHNLVRLLDKDLFGVVAVPITIIIGIGWLIKTIELSAGGRAVANMFRARLVPQSTTNLQEKTLLNVVEEMSIASTTPMPQVYVLDGEPGINAFAAGYSRGDTVICVTRGALDQLTRDELQGVVGHEYSHILNGDMALNMKLLAMVFGITCIAQVGWWICRSTGNSDDSRSGLGAIAFGLSMVLIGGIGALVGSLLQAAISRQRESLADAAATQFTRNPQGLKNALLKIAGLPQGSSLQSPKRAQINHFLFGESGGISSLFATHPPLAERIKALDPSFDVKRLDTAYKRLLAEQQANAPVPTTAEGQPAAVTLGLVATAAAGLAQEAINAAVAGAPQPPQKAAPSPLEELGVPSPIRQSARDLLGANALIFGMLLSNETSVREKQLAVIDLKGNRLVGSEMDRLLPDIESLSEDQKLALVCVAVSALKGLSLRQYDEFLVVFNDLIEADGCIDIFEYMLSKSVYRNLDGFFRSKQRRSLIYRFEDVGEPIRVVLSAIARQMPNEGDADSAYKQAVKSIPGLGETLPVPASECQFAQLDESLEKLAQTCFDIRTAVVRAAAGIVMHDQVATINERALVSAFADALETRMPELPDMRVQTRTPV